MISTITRLLSLLLFLSVTPGLTLAAPASRHSNNGLLRRACHAKQTPSPSPAEPTPSKEAVPVKNGLGENLDSLGQGDAKPVNQGPDGDSAVKGPDPDSNLDLDDDADRPDAKAYPVDLAPAPSPSPVPAQPPSDGNADVCVSSLLPPMSRAITFHQPLSQILSHTTDAIRVLTGNVNTNTGQFNQGGGEFFVWASSNGWTSIAINDRLNGKKEFEQDVSRGLQAMADHWVMGGEKWKVPLVNEFNDDSGWAGLAAAEAYDAYGDERYLKWAIGVFDFLLAHGYVHQKDIDAGFLEGTKDSTVKILKECNGKSLLGGVAWKNTPDGAGLNAVSTGNFALLAAELCRITGDKQKYCDPAVQSMRFLDDHLLMPDGLLKDHIISDSCQGENWKLTYNAGLYIATYASLGATLSNPEFTARAEAMITASLKTPEWNTDMGVIKQESGEWDKSDDGLGFKLIYVRYLQKVHPWLNDQKVKDAIVQYVNIQYDSLVWLASDSAVKPVNFGRSWDGNGGKGYQGSTVHSQIAALDALNAIQLNPASAFPDHVDGDSITTSKLGVARC